MLQVDVEKTPFYQMGTKKVKHGVKKMHHSKWMLKR